MIWETDRMHPGNHDVVDSPEHADVAAFALYWESMVRQNMLPKRADFDVLNMKKWIGSIIIMNFLDNDLDFQYRLIGTKIVRAIGRDLTGLRISECEYSDRKENIIQTFLLPIKERKPIFRRGHVDWIEKKDWRNYESVHCPLASDGKNIDMTIGFQIYT